MEAKRRLLPALLVAISFFLLLLVPSINADATVEDGSLDIVQDVVVEGLSSTVTGGGSDPEGVVTADGDTTEVVPRPTTTGPSFWEKLVAFFAGSGGRNARLCEMILDGNVTSVDKEAQAAIILEKDKVGTKAVNKPCPRTTRLSPLHLAIQGGHHGLLHYLLSMGAKPDSRDKVGRTPLMHALELRDLTSLTALVAASANVALVDPTRSMTPLQWAVSQGLEEVAVVLLDHPVDNAVNEFGSLDTTALHLACKNQSHLHLVQLLVEHQADVNLADRSSDQYAPVHYAAQGGLADLASYLVSVNANLEAKDGQGNTVFHLLVNKPHMETLKKFLEAGSHVKVALDAENKAGRTALHEAMAHDKIDLVKALLAGGADVDSYETTDTPFVEAIKLGHTEIAMTLLDHGANLDATDSHTGWTALHFLSAQNDAGMTLQVVEKKANLNHLNPNGYSPLRLAITTHSTEVAEVLLSHGAIMDPNTLHLAVSQGDAKLVEQITSMQGVDVNARDEQGFQPLHYAFQIDRPDLVSLLAEKGAEVDATEAPGMPPLLLRAAADGRLAMVKALVKRAHVNYMHEDKVTPLSAALEKGHLDVAQVLIDNGAQVDAPLVGGKTVLHLASLEGDVSKVDFLLNSHKASVNARDDHNDTTLLIALRSHHHDVTRLVLSHGGADVSAMSSLDNKTALHHAVTTQEPDLVNNILKHLNTREINLRDGEGQTPLSLALGLDNIDLATTLVDRGADVNLTYPPTEMNLLHQAVLQSSLEEVEFLLGHGIDASLTDTKGNTPLHMAIFRAPQRPTDRRLLTKAFDMVSLKMIRHLLHYNPSLINQGDGDGLTPLAHAILTEDPILVRLLAAHGADLDRRYSTNLTDYTLVHQLAQSGVDNILTVLALSKANLDLPVICNPPAFHGCISEGLTALLLSYLRRQWSTFKVLLEFGADPNIPELSQGNTVLHLTLRDKDLNTEKRLQVVELLLRNGADTKKTNNDDITPEKLARERRDKKLLELMDIYANVSSSIRSLRDFVETEIEADREAENERKVDALLEEKDTCLARHHHLEQNMTAMLKEEAKLRGTISSQQTHIQDLDSLSESLRAELEEANVKVNEGKKFQQMLISSEERERALVASKQKLEERLLDLMPCHDQAMNLSAKFTELQMTTKWKENMSKAKLEALKASKDDLQSQIHNKTELIANLHNKVAQLEALLKDREVSISHLKEEARVLAVNHTREIIAHKDVEVQLAKELTSIKEQLTDAKVDFNHCEERIRSIELRLQQKDNEIKNAYEHSANVNLTCSNDKATLNQDWSQLRARNAECVVRKAELEKEVAELSKKIEKCQQDMMTFRVENAKEALKLKESQVSLTDRKAKVDASLATCEAQNASCQRDRTSLEGRITSVEGLHRDCTKARSQMDNTIAQCTQALTDAHKKLGSIEEKLKKKKAGGDD